MQTDVLIIGGGLAALQAARSCAQAGVKTLLAVKSILCSGSSFYPLTPALGCLAPRRDDPADAQAFMDEINGASQGMNDPELGWLYIQDIHDRVAALDELGLDAHIQKENRVACFATRERELVVWDDWPKTRTRVRKRVSSWPTVSLLEQTAALSLLQTDGVVTGAVLAGLRPGDQPFVVQARSVVLATGGFGALYRHHLNTRDVDGSGHALAAQAGARLRNLEFIQFIPGFLKPKYKVLFSELCLPDSLGLFDAAGKNLLTPVLPGGWSLQKLLDTRGRHGPFTLSDGSGVFDQAIMAEIARTGRDDAVDIRFDPRLLSRPQGANSRYLTWMRDRMHIDLLADRLSIAPFAQASNGGIVIDRDGWTGVPGLYAAGEVAGTMHGADRIGGCAAGNCLVFGHRAAVAAAARVQSQAGQAYPDVPKTLLEDWRHDRGNASHTPQQVLEEIGTRLWQEAAIIRTEKGLTAARAALDALAASFHPGSCLEAGAGYHEVARAAHGLTLARLILDAMLQRRESRGPHFRADYPRQQAQARIQDLCLDQQGTM